MSTMRSTPNYQQSRMRAHQLPSPLSHTHPHTSADRGLYSHPHHRCHNHSNQMHLRWVACVSFNCYIRWNTTLRIIDAPKASHMPSRRSNHSASLRTRRFSSRSINNKRRAHSNTHTLQHHITIKSAVCWFGVEFHAWYLRVVTIMSAAITRRERRLDTFPAHVW